MPEYDEFAETYQHWSVTASPYNRVEVHTFFEVLGSVRGLDVLDLAAGEGRTSRMLMERGARSVLGGDVSPEMVRRATAHNAEKPAWPTLRYMVLDASDDAFQLDAPVDAVTAMYLFHYAPSEDDLERMARLIARNLKPGGRFVTYTLSPDYDFRHSEPRLMEHCGFDYAVVSGPHLKLIIAGKQVDIWQWGREVHESRLDAGGLADIRWHPLQAPPDAPEVVTALDFYLTNPSCIVLSAIKPE